MRAKDRARYWANREGELAEQKRWRQEHPEHVKARDARYHKKDSVKRVAYAREWEMKHPGSKQRSNFRAGLKRYGLTEADWKGLVERDPVCAICGRSSSRRLCIDHDHATGRVRGLLCNMCNRVLHNLENSKWMADAETYLHR